jgi:hypothetical protein
MSNEGSYASYRDLYANLRLLELAKLPVAVVTEV